VKTVTHSSCFFCDEVVPVEVDFYGGEMFEYTVSGGPHGDGSCPWHTGFSHWVRVDACVSSGVVYHRHASLAQYTNGPLARDGECDMRSAEHGDSCMRCGMRAMDRQMKFRDKHGDRIARCTKWVSATEFVVVQ
jgi:hypothetical protein